MKRYTGGRYKVRVKAGQVRFIPGDIHFGCHDLEALEASLDYAEDYAKHAKLSLGGTLTGDVFDTHSVSRHPRKAARLAAMPTLMDEIKVGRPYLERMAAWPDGTDYTLGNHEDWVEQLFDTEPGLAGAPGLQWANLTGIGDIEGLTVLPYNTWMVYGDKVAVHHGKGLPASPVAVARKYPDQFTVYGHTHVAGMAFNTVYDIHGYAQTRGAMNVGFLGAIPEYAAPDPNWQWSFGLIEWFGDRGNGQPFFRASLHHVVRDKKGKCLIA